MDEKPFDAADLTWGTLQKLEAHGMILYEDRPLTRWEKVKKHFGFEPKPHRIVGVIQFDGRETPAQ